MGLVFSHAISAALFYLRPQRALGDGNGKENKLIFDGLLEECLLPVVDAESPTELREAVRQGVSRCLGSNSSQVKVYLKTPVSGSLVDDNGRSLPSTGFINEVLSQRGKTIINASKNQDSIPDLSSNQHSNDSNGSTSVFLLPIPERETHKAIGLVVVETSASNISNSETKRLELCIKQASVTYEAIKARRAKETEATPASLLSLIQLCSDLNDQDAVKLQQKVIRYLCKHTGAKTGFILLVVPETHELFCQTVGDIPLQEELRYADGHSDFAQALETRQPLRITDLKEDGILTVEKIVGFPLKSFLCVPVSVSDGKELLALTCLVNKENDQEFDNDDTEIVTQCFKYTATVLSSTLAFQNERKLKNQTQALLQVAKKLFTRLGKFTSSKTSFSPRVIFNPTDTCKINDGLIVCDESSINRSSKGLQESEPYDISNSSMDFIEQKTNEQSDEIDKMTSISEQEHRIRMQETKHLAVKAKVYDRTTPMEEEQSVLFGLDERLQDQSSTKFGVESNDKDDEMSFKQNCLPSLVNSSTMLCHLSHQLHEKLYHHMQCLKQLQEKLENKVDTRLTISCNASRSDDKSKREDALDSQEETTTLLMCQIKCLVESISNFESGQEDKYWKTVDRTVQTMSESDEACPMGWEFDVQNNYTSKNINIDVGSEMSSQQENGTRHGNETDSIAGRLNEKLDETHNSGGKWSLKVYVTDIVTDLVEKSMDLASVNGSVAPPVTDQTFGDGEMMCFGRSLSDEDLDVVDANVDITAWKMEVTTEKTDTFGVNMDASNCLHYSIADIEEIIDEEGKKSDSSNGIQYPWSNGGCRERDADVLSTLSMSNDAMTKVDCDIIPLIKDFEKQDESGIVAMDGLLPLSVQDSVASMDSKKSIDSELPLSEHDNEGIDMPSDSFHHIASDVENEIDSEGNVEEYCVNDDFQTWLNMSYSVHKDDISFIPNLDVLTDSYSMLEDLSESDMSKSEENNRFVLDGERKIISYEGNDNKDKKKPYCESVSSYYSISGDSVDEDVYDFDSSDYHHNSCEENNEDNETFNKDNSSGVICFQSKDKTFPVFNVTTEMSFDRSEEMVSDTHKNVCIDHESPKNDEFCQAGKICHFVENRITNNIDNGIEPQSNRNWSCWEDMFGGESHIFEELRISTCSGQENSKIVNEEIKDFEETDDDKPMAQSTPKSSSDFHKNVFERGDLSPASTISFIDKASDFLKLDTDGEKALEANVMCCPNDNDVHSCQSYVTVEETDDTDSFKNDMCSSEKDDMLLQHVGFECQNLVDQDIIHTLQDFPSGIIKDGLSQYYDSQTQEIQNEHQSIEGLDDYQLQKFQEVLSELKSLKISVDSQSLKVSKEHLSMENSVESQSLVVSIRPQLLEVANQLHPVSQDVREEHQSQRDSNDCAFFEVLNWTQSLEVSGEPQFQEVSDKSLSLLSLEVSGKSQPLEVPDTLHLAEVSNDPYSQTVSDESSCVEFPNEYQPWKVPDTPQHLKISNGHQIRVLDEPQSLVLQECHPQEILYEFHCLGCTSEFQPLDILYETQSKSHDILDEPHTLDISDVPPSQTVPDDSPSHPSHEYNSQKVHLDEVVHIPENSDCPEVDLFSKNDDTVFSDNASQTPSDSIFASCDECQQDFEISMSRAPRSDKSAVESPKQEPGICNDTFLEKSFVCVSDDEYHKVSESISYSPHQLDPFLEGRNEIKDQISSLNASVDEIQNQTFVLPENENKSEDQISTKLESSNEIYDQFCQLDKSHNQAKDQISSLSISNDKKHSLILSQVECPEILSRIFFENDKLVSLTENNDIKDSKTIGSSDGSQDVISLPHDETEDEHCPCFIAVDKISDLNSLSCESNILNQDLNFTCHNRIDEIKNLNSSYTVNHGEIQEPDSSLDHNEDEIRDINSSHTVNHGEIQEPDSSLDHNEDEIQNLNSSHTVNHGEIQEPDSSLDHNQDEIQDINSSYTVNHGEIQEPDSSLDHNQDEIQDIDSSLQFSSEQIHDHNSSLYDYDDEIQYFSSPPCNLNSSLHGSNCEIQYFDSSLHNNNNGINELDSWLHHSNDKVHDCTSSLHDSSDEIHNLNSPCHDCSDEIHNLNPPCCDSSDEIHNLNSPCHDSNDEIHDINGSFHDNTDEIHINSSHYHSIGETQELNSPQHDSNNEFHELDFSFHDSNGEIQDENYIMQFKQKSPVLECNDGVFDITFSVPEIEFNVEDQVSVEFDINHESTQNYNSPSHESSSDQVKDSNSALLDNSDERKNLNFPLHKKKNEIHPLSQTSTFPQHHHELKNSKSCVSRICDQIIDQKSKEEESTPDQTYVFPQKDQTSIEIHDNHNKTLDYGSALVGDEIVNVIKPVRLCHPFYTPLCENHDIPHALPSQDQNGFENTELFSKQHHAYAHSGWNDDNGSEAEPALNPSIVSKGSSALDVTGPYESDLFSEEDQAFDGDVSCLDETCHTRGLGDEALLEMWDRTYDMTFSKPVTVSDTYCGYDYFNLSNAYQPYSNTRMVYASSTSNSSTQNHGIVSEKGIYDGLNACLDNVHPIPEVCFESEGICKMDKFKPIVHIKACHESCQDKKRAEGKFNFQYLDALRVSDEDRISLPRTKSNDFSCKLDCDGSSLKRVVNSKELKDVEDFVNGETFTMCPGGDSINYNEHNVRRTLKYFPDVCYNSDEDKMMETIPEDEKSIVFERTNNELQKSDHAKSVNDVLSNIFMNKSDVLSESDSSLPYEPRIDKMNLDTETSHDKNAKDSYTFYSDSVIEPRRILFDWDFKKSQREYQVVTSHNSHPTIESALLNNETIPKSSKDKFEGINEQNEIEMKLTNDDVIRCQNTVHENVCNTNRLALVPLGIDAVMEQNAFQCNDFEEVDTNMDITPIEINYEPFLEVNRSFNRVLHTSDLEVISEEESDENSHASLSLNNLETSEHSEGMDSSSGDQENVFGDKDVFYKSDLIQNDKHDDLCESELSQNNDTDYLPSIHNTTFTAEDNDYKAYFFPPVLIDPETEIVRKDNIKKVNEGVNDDVFEEDDLNASSEAYSDNMERLGSSEDHLLIDSSDSRSGDSDILKHTSSDLNLTRSDDQFLLDKNWVYEYEERHAVSKKKQYLFDCSYEINGKKFVGSKVKRVDHCVTYHLYDDVHEHHGHKEFDSHLPRAAISKEMDGNNDCDVSSSSYIHDEVNQMKENTKIIADEDVTDEVFSCIRSVLHEFTEGPPTPYWKTDSLPNRGRQYEDDKNEIFHDYNNTVDVELKERYNSFVVYDGNMISPSDAGYLCAPYHIEPFEKTRKKSTTYEEIDGTECTGKDFYTPRNTERTPMDCSNNSKTRDFDVEKAGEDCHQDTYVSSGRSNVSCHRRSYMRGYHSKRNRGSHETNPNVEQFRLGENVCDRLVLDLATWFDTSEKAEQKGTKEGLVKYQDIIGSMPVYYMAALWHDDLTKLLREIMQEARNLTDAERCSVFLLDKDSDELVAMVFDGITAEDKERLLRGLRTRQDAKKTVQGEIRLPKTQGIAGHVATTGTLLNIRDAYSHPLFYRGIDDSTGFRTRNILCFPIKDEDGVVLGVAQLCNKKTFQYFTTFDEDVASAFAVYCCISISHSLMYKKVIDIQYRNSLANELMMFHMKSLMYKKLQDTQHRQRLANDLMMFHLNQQVPGEEVTSMANMTIPSIINFSPSFDTFDYAPRTIPECQTVLACLSMFEDLGFSTRWRIKLDTLVRFVLMVKKGYRNPPYHNWMHAFAVTHFCYLLIKNLHLQNYLEDIELLALFVSCMCHDIDHRGTTNSFQVQSQTVLAALYSSEGSVMERHHLAQSMCILNTEGSNLFEQLSSKEYQTVLDLMKEIILATDLAHHLRSVKEQDRMSTSDDYDKNNPTDRYTLLCLLMTACDLSDQTKNWNNTKLIASLVYQEFFSQGDLEKALGKNPMEMMDRERACIPELQIAFLDNIAAPVYKILVQMFPEAEVVQRNVEDNRKHWVHIRELLKSSKQVMSVEEIISLEEEPVDELKGNDINVNNNMNDSCATNEINGR